MVSWAIKSYKSHLLCWRRQRVGQSGNASATRSGRCCGHIGVDLCVEELLLTSIQADVGQGVPILIFVHLLIFSLLNVSQVGGGQEVPGLLVPGGVPCLARLYSCLARLSSCLARLSSCLVRLSSCLARMSSCLARLSSCLARLSSTWSVQAATTSTSGRGNTENMESSGSDVLYVNVGDRQLQS